MLIGKLSPKLVRNYSLAHSDFWAEYSWRTILWNVIETYGKSQTEFDQLKHSDSADERQNDCVWLKCSVNTRTQLLSMPYSLSENAKVDVYAFLFDDMLLLTRFRKLPLKVNKVWNEKEFVLSCIWIFRNLFYSGRNFITLYLSMLLIMVNIFHLIRNWIWPEWQIVPHPLLLWSDAACRERNTQFTNKYVIQNA